MKTLLMTFLTVSTVFAWSWVVVQIIDWRSNKKWLAEREKRDLELARDNHYDAARETLQRVRAVEGAVDRLTKIVAKQNKGKKS